MTTCTSARSPFLPGPVFAAAEESMADLEGLVRDERGVRLGREEAD